MNLSTVCQANSFLKKEAKAGHRLASDEKLELILKLEGQSVAKVDKILLANSDQLDIHFRESVKQKTESLTQIRLLKDEETLANLKRVKEIRAHALPNATFAQIIAELAKMGVEKLDPELKAKRATERSVGKVSLKSIRVANVDSDIAKSCALGESKLINKSSGWARATLPIAKIQSDAFSEVPKKIPHVDNKNTDNVPADVVAQAPAATPISEPKSSRYIPAAARHFVWMRDKGRCTYVDLRTGECCGSRRFIECDHVRAFANGGAHSVENLRLRCRAHNQRHAIETLGARALLAMSPERKQ